MARDPTDPDVELDDRGNIVNGPTVMPMGRYTPTDDDEDDPTDGSDTDVEKADPEDFR